MNQRLHILAMVIALPLCGCPPGGGGTDAGSDAAGDAGSDDGSSVGDATGDGAEVGTDAGGDGATVDGGGEGGDATVVDSSVLDATTDVQQDVDASEAGEASAGCGYDAGSVPDGAPVCGDGWRDPTEECDDGLASASRWRRSCSAQCQVLDELAVWQTGADGGLSNSPRTLGTGRHPLASSDSSFGVVYLEPNGTPLTLSLATFDPRGAATGLVNAFSGGSTVVTNSNPVVAGLSCGQYAVAWADFDSEGGDELDIALRIVDPATPTSGPALHANTTTVFSQFDPDVLWTGSQLVVAWVDTSNAATQPDLVVRTFDGSLHPTSGEQVLAGTADSEADVALAPFAGTWAAAWRDDASGLETIQVQAGATRWSVGPAFLPALATAKPALAPLDATHLLVAYSVGADTTDSGVANGSVLMVAVLDTAAPGSVTGEAVAAQVPSAIGLDQSYPAAVTIGSTAYLAWWTAGALGDPNGEELWLKSLGWNGSGLDVSAGEVPLPRWGQARLGDQEAPALAASTLPPGGALVGAWDDLAAQLAAGEGPTDAVVELMPAPLLREAGDGGP